LPQHPEPTVNLPNASFGEPAGTLRTFRPPRDQSGLLEHLQVLRNRRLRQPKGLYQFHHRSFALRQPRQNRPPGRVG